MIRVGFRSLNRMLRDRRALVLDLDVKVLVGKDVPGLIENPRQLTRRQTVGLIAAEPDLQLNGVDLPNRAAAVDEPLSDMTDLGDVEMTGDRDSVGKTEAERLVGLIPEPGSEISEFHGGIYIPVWVYVQR